jgi:pyruvate,water dikinase
MDEWIDRILREFAKDGLKASVLAGMSYSNLQAALNKCFGQEGRGILESLIVGLEGDLTVETNQKLWEVAHGRLSMQEFLESYGHRAVGELELAQPRWREDSAFVESMVAIFRENKDLDPGVQFFSQKEKRKKAEVDLREQLSVGKARAYRKNILREVQYAQRYLPYRETAKFYLMMGYELIRNALLELGRRHLDPAEDIFYLTPDELLELVAGEDLRSQIEERRDKRSRLLSIELPDVIFSDSLHQIGNPPLPEFSQELEGTSVSSGVATGRARVILKPPQTAEHMELGYILVCPSTDPGWAPLFPSAHGLVMERGGVLSHGAIVAREYGIPAVANIPGATRLIKDGQKIKIDGDEGKVFLTNSSD